MSEPLTVRDLIASLSKLPPDTPLMKVSGIGISSSLFPAKKPSDFDLYTTMYRGQTVLYSAWQSHDEDNGTSLDFAPTAEPNANK